MTKFLLTLAVGYLAVLKPAQATAQVEVGFISTENDRFKVFFCCKKSILFSSDEIIS